MPMTVILKYLSRWSISKIYALAFFSLAVIGAADFIIGPEISTTLFYFLPIAISSWYGGRSFGIAVSFAAAFVWLMTDIGSGREYAHAAIFIWNTLIRLGIFLFVSLLLSAFHDLLKSEKHAADTDPLTGALNVRGFREKLVCEYVRSTRSHKPFSLAFIDIDDFKEVNDTLGHGDGDILLCTVTDVMKYHLRRTDVLARLGGDEFAILFSETDEALVKAAFSHVHQCLMRTVAEHHWPVTFSVGVISYQTLPENPSHALRLADELMYIVKKSTKNDVIYKVWSGTSLEPRLNGIAA